MIATPAPELERPWEDEDERETGYRVIIERWLRQDGWRLAKQEFERRRVEALDRLATVNPNNAAGIATLQTEANIYAKILADPITFLSPPRE